MFFKRPSWRWKFDSDLSISWKCWLSKIFHSNICIMSGRCTASGCLVIAPHSVLLPVVQEEAWVALLLVCVPGCQAWLFSWSPSNQHNKNRETRSCSETLDTYYRLQPFDHVAISPVINCDRPRRSGCMVAILVITYCYVPLGSHSRPPFSWSPGVVRFARHDPTLRFWPDLTRVASRLK